MITRSYHFNEACYEYDVVDVEVKENGKLFIAGSYTMDWYNGKSNIPSVPRKEKPKEVKQ